MWYYGGSFSQRVFVDYLAFFAILLAISFMNIPSGWKRNTYLSLTFVLLLFCQFQTYQYRHMVIHWSDMTKEMYWENFWKLDL
jgi:heme/copper-type cytochrome/quinol oxidase subunit 3